MERKVIKFVLIHKGAVLPRYATKGDSGFDIFTCEDVVVPSLTTVLVRTGLIPIIPDGWDIKVFPKSGISLNYHNYLANNVGLIDNYYRNEIKVPVRNNLFNRDMVIKSGSKIAQGVVQEVHFFDIEESKEDPGVGRGGGFGSTGGVEITADKIRKVFSKG